MHRRGFMAFATALLFPPLSGSVQASAVGQQIQNRVDLIRAELIHYARTLNTRHAIGNTWLATQLPWPALKTLVDALTARLAEQHSSNVKHIDIRSLLATQVRLDFRTGNTVRLNGWILSASEAQLCGVACLLADHPRLS